MVTGRDRTSSNRRMKGELVIRATAALLGAAAFMPWYSSKALVNQDTYLGNPLPWIDWLLIVAAVAAVIKPALAFVPALIGVIDVSLGALLMYGDAAEGIDVQLLPGLPLAAVATLALLTAAKQRGALRSAPGV
ncbi:MAG: hypothetical protein ACRDJS_01975 [Actinomycetota bacterium]